MKTIVCLALIIISLFVVLSRYSQTQSACDSKNAQPLLSGWSAQGWQWDQNLASDPANWTNFVTEAFQYAPNGSFFEYMDEYTVTVYANQDVIDHKIPVDVGGKCRLFLDGVFIEVNPSYCDHYFYTLDLPEGQHCIDLILYNDKEILTYWTVLGVGDCLWGIDSRIEFVKAGK